MPESDEHGAGDDGVADVERVEVGDGKCSGNVPVVEAVPGIDAEAELVGERGAVNEPFDLGGSGGGAGGVGVGAGVKLDVLRADIGGGANLVEIGR